MAATPFAVALLPTRGQTEATDPAVVGQWSAPFDLGGVAIHATLLYSDDILWFQDVEGTAGSDKTSLVGTWNWRTGVSRSAPFSYNRDVFCAFHNVLPDGRLFVNGGHDFNTGQKQDAYGVRECDIYDPATRIWTKTAPMVEKRWYPTSIGLSNGKSLIFGGVVSPGVYARTVEEYDYPTNTMRTRPSTATKQVGLYPRMHLLANGRIYKSGPQQQTAAFNPATNTWTNVAMMTGGSRRRGSTALLPGATKILTVGGGGTPVRTAELLDTSLATPVWRATGSLTFARYLANTVVLPDGQVFLIGGGRAFKYTDPVKTPELWNPTTGSWTSMAPHQASRMYHATALLLPDGRVFTAGQDNGSLARFAEIWSPPYLFKGSRPTLSGAPATVARGGQLQFVSPQAASLSKVVLIRPGSNTHEIDSDQRSVPLTFTTAGTTVTAQVPTNANLLPPSRYMLFIVDNNGVPGIASWLRVS
jgi:hypothetical protein